MKKLILTFVGLLLIGCTTIMPEPAQIEASSISVVIAGDSNSQAVTLLQDIQSRIVGKGKLAGTQTKGWIWKGNQLANGYKSPPHEGYGGRGVAYLQQRVVPIVKSIKGPKIVVLNIGANDMWVSLSNRKPISDAQAVNVATAWRKMADSFLNVGADVVAVMPTTPSNAQRPLAILRNHIQAWAIARKAPLVDLKGCVNDGVHFKSVPAGHGEMAKRYYNGLINTKVWSGINPEPEPPEPPITNQPPVTASIVLESFGFDGKTVTPPSGPEGWMSKFTEPRYEYSRWICDIYAVDGLIITAMWGNGQSVQPPATVGKWCAWSQFPIGKPDLRLNKYTWRYVTGNKYNLIAWPK